MSSMFRRVVLMGLVALGGQVYAAAPVVAERSAAVAPATAPTVAERSVDGVPAAAPAGAGKSTGAAPAADPALLEDLPFRPGERLEFALEYGLIPAGSATLEVGAVESFMGRPCVRLKSRARSAEAFDLIYKVDDEVASLFDLKEHYTWRFERHLREGTYRKDETVVFDPANHIARYDNGKIYRVPARAQDVLSALYYLRTQELRPGSTIHVPTHTDYKNYALEVSVLREERVATALGEFDCVVVEPQLQSEGIFRQEGKLLVWMTRDARHLPVLMQTQVVIGHVTATLRGWEGVGEAAPVVAAVGEDSAGSLAGDADSSAIQAVAEEVLRP